MLDTVDMSYEQHVGHEWNKYVSISSHTSGRPRPISPHGYVGNRLGGSGNLKVPVSSRTSHATPSGHLSVNIIFLCATFQEHQNLAVDSGTSGFPHILFRFYTHRFCSDFAKALAQAFIFIVLYCGMFYWPEPEPCRGGLRH